MAQPSDQSRLAAAAYVARSAGRSCSMAKGVAMGLPAFISEFRMAMATTTVHRTGRTEHHEEGDAHALHQDDGADLAEALASAGWGRIAMAVPRPSRRRRC